MHYYTFSEVVQEITNNPRLRFENKDIDIEISFFENKLSVIERWHFGTLAPIGLNILNAIYTKMAEKVSYIEALQAFEKGKIIEVTKVDTLTKKIESRKLDSTMDNFEFCLDDIKYGEWRILD